jgi:hypothetical protein
MRGLVASVAAATIGCALLLAGGCMVFTGSTDNYSSPDTDAGGGSCTSASNCGDGGQVCCLVESASATSTSGTCEPTCTIPSSYPQLCATNAECGDAGACTKQSCTVNLSGTSIPVSVQACGIVAGCKAQ